MPQGEARSQRPAALPVGEQPFIPALSPTHTHSYSGERPQGAQVHRNGRCSGQDPVAVLGLQHGGFWAALASWLRSWVNRSCSPTLGLFICVRLSPSSLLSLQFHHVPLYLEWAPVGVFTSSAPQKEEPQDTAVDRADEDRAEPETGESCVGSGCPGTGPRAGGGRP